MRIGIDARFYGSLGKGLGRYTQQLIAHLEQQDFDNEYIIFLREANFHEYRPNNKKFQKVLADVPWYGWREQCVLPTILARYKLDLVHFPHFNVPILYRKRFVVTVHDLILLHYPTLRATRLHPFYYWIKFWVYRIVLRRALSNSAHVFSVSHFTKRDILKRFPISEQKITVVQEAGSNLSRFEGLKRAKHDSDIHDILRKYGILQPYILYVGNAYPHKNLERLLEGFWIMQEPHVQLVLVGKTDFFYDELRSKIGDKQKNNIIFTGFVPDEDLDMLYRQAMVYVFPSLYEGFGLPPLEAMERGVPVVSSHAASMPEILGSAARYFDPQDSGDIARVLTEVIEDSALRHKMKQKGYERARVFSWRESAQTTHDVYRAVLNQR